MKYFSFFLVLLAVSSMSEAQIFGRIFDRMNDAFNRMNIAVDRLVDQMNLRRNLTDVMPDIGDLLSNMSNVNEVMECYVDELNGQQLNIFNGSMSLDVLSRFYYVSL